MKKKKIINLILNILTMIVATLGSAYIIYALSLLSGVETFTRLVLMLIIAAIWLCIVVTTGRMLKRKKGHVKAMFVIVLIYSLIISGVGFYIIKTYTTIADMTTSSTSYSTSLVALKDDKAENLETLGDGKIGILSDTTSIVGNTLPLEIIEENKIKNEVLEYETFLEVIKALYDEEIEYAFLPTNYGITFSSIEGANLEKIEEETKTIYSETKEIEDVKKDKQSLDEPFTILIMGVDSELESISNASFNGDSLMLITFNPQTLSSTILSIPRDSYVPIACFAGQRKNKITHAAWYGEKCMMETIENFTDIKIDYYVKINFKGVVKLVDTLGGVEIDVPYAFCEQNSNREWGKGTVYVEEGLQTLNGEQALAFARNRHTWPQYCSAKYSNYVSNDFIRGQHQQEVVRALLNKLKDVKSLNTVSEVLDTVSTSMETNMSTTEMLSLYNVGKDILAKSNGSNFDDLVSMQRLYLNGTDSYIYDASMGLNLYNYVLYQESIDAVSEAMKINLGLEKPKLTKKFAFSIDEEYEEEVIGKNVYGANSVAKLPNFIGDTEAQARATCARLGISVSFKYVQTGTGTNNTVIDQSQTAGLDLSYVKSISLTILQKKEEVKKPTVTVDKKEEPKKEEPKVEEEEKDEEEPKVEEEEKEPTNQEEEKEDDE